MTLDNFKQLLLAKALEKGCEAAEVYASETDSFSTEVLDGKLDKYSVSSDRGLSLRVIYKGHDGFANTEVFDNADELVNSAIDNAAAIDSTDDHPMQKKCTYKELSKPCLPLTELNEKECISLCLDTEKKALESDKRIKRVNGCGLQKSTTKSTLVNTYGLDASDVTTHAIMYLSVVIGDNEGENEGYSIKIMSDATTDTSDLIKEAIKECDMRLNASPVSAGEYKVLFTNKAFSDMLELFIGVFSADAAQKSLSLLAGKEGEMIASDCVTLCDDPFYSMYPISFDGEGTPTKYKNIIENGKLLTLVHSLKTAKKANVESTGNGSRTGKCIPTNVYIKPGSKSFDELLKGERILVINELDGAGTGVNEVSGEFSLSARGQLYENGKHVKNVNQITVAGTFYELLKNITDVGNDLKVINLFGMGILGSPSVLVDKLIIAG